MSSYKRANADNAMNQLHLLISYQMAILIKNKEGDFADIHARALVNCSAAC